MLSAQFKQLRFLNICHRHIVRLSPNGGGRQMQMAPAFAQSFSTSTKLGYMSFENLNAGWKCPRCLLRNYPDRISCHGCGHSPSEGSVGSNENMWPCSGCNVLNYNDRTACFKCGIAKPANIRSFHGETSPDGSWFCVKCEFRNYPTRDTCRRCTTAPTEEQQHNIDEKSGVWLCGSCGNKNFRSKMECNRCKVAKGREVGMNG
uniref:RanBP2-type domain-containing protein n=1 Tax=Globodera rostochiensis TaxID=31243 RepID=A0A914HSQ6_GLORO